jgi:hypothetical protein
MTATLLVTIDTEEEFDWNAPVSRANRSVDHVRSLPRLQELFEEVGVRPTYVVDHPIATTEKSVDLLGSYLKRNACEIGTHIHPWVNPPDAERIEPRNSYLSNLPLELQQEKLTVLTEAIRTAFGQSPTTFKAGRYGIDFRLAPHLESLGYTVDTSVIAYMDFTADEGPSFADFGSDPYWLIPPASGRQPLLEVPCTVGFTRRPFSWWSRVHRFLAADRFHTLHPIGIMWHLGIMRKVVLSPEGTEVGDQIRLLKLLGRNPDVVLNVTLHSPSVEPGRTPFVRTADDVESFFARLRATLQFALKNVGARPLTFREFAASYARTAAI